MKIERRQDQERLTAWRAELKRQILLPIAHVSWEGFTTLNRLTPLDAEKQEMHAFPPGTPWGSCWEYGWFRTDLHLPDEATNRQMLLDTGLGGEQLIYVNGHPVGSIDHKHLQVTLPRWTGNEPIHILVESYAGHGARLENYGPCPPERKAIPSVPNAQCCVTGGTVYAMDEDAYQLYMDVEALCGLLEVLPQKSLRGMQVLDALMAFTHLVDFEVCREDRGLLYRTARKKLAPILSSPNGPTVPKMHIFGQSHIDIAWLWPQEETYHKVSRTYANQLSLMDQYPEYRFLCCEPELLRMLQVHSQELWYRLLDAVQRGHVIIDGAFYVECDTNLPSGESLIRQLLWGKQWFKEHFGVQSRVAWQPDTFGFSGALPQILKELEIPYFATQKLLRAHPEYPAFPYENFIWEGIDGSQVQALSFFRCNAELKPSVLNARWEEKRVQQHNIDTLLYPFGYGDGGGGPTQDMLEMARRLHDLEGLPKTEYGTLESYFKDAESSALSNRHVGELYLQWHRGVFSVQRRTKVQMRRLEEALHNVELLLCMLPMSDCTPWQPRVKEAWHTLLVNQFHDIAAGVGIQRVHKESEESLSMAVQGMHILQDLLIEQIAVPVTSTSGKLQPNEQHDTCVNPINGTISTTPDQAYGIFNPLPWTVQGFVSLPDGNRIWQRMEPGIFPLNWNTPQPKDAQLHLSSEGFILRNSLLQFTVTNDGCIHSILCPSTGTILTEPECRLNKWRIFRQVESVYDAWELSDAYEADEIQNCIHTDVSVVEQSPESICLRICRNFLHSFAEQLIRLDAGSPYISVENHVNWQERHMLLKADFETGFVCRQSLHEIQFGRITRPSHRSSPEAFAQFEGCQHRYSAVTEGNRGLAVLNDGLYSVSAKDGTLSLTLLRSPVVPDDTCDLGNHTFTFALYPFTGQPDERIVRAGYELNQRPILHKGQVKPCPSFACEGAVLETVKPPEDGQDGAILRLYESTGSTAMAKLSLPESWRLIECSMDEQNLSDRLPQGHTATADESQQCHFHASKSPTVENQTKILDPNALRFRPYQIRTFRAICI